MILLIYLSVTGTEFYGEKRFLMRKITMTIAMVLFLIFVGCSSKSGADLIEAVKSNDLEKVKKIADSKNVNATDEMNATPAMWAAYNGNVEILDLLVKNGADVIKKGIIGINTENIPKTYTNALIAAAGEGHLDAVKYLVEKAGVHPDEKGDCLNLFIILPEDIKTTNGLIDFVKESEGKFLITLEDMNNIKILLIHINKQDLSIYAGFSIN
jgi:ankyrin repeat protein